MQVKYFGKKKLVLQPHSTIYSYTVHLIIVFKTHLTAVWKAEPHEPLYELSSDVAVNE